MATARERWLSQPAIRALEADFQRYAQGEQLGARGALAALFEDSEAALRLAERFFTSGMTALAAHPLGEIAHRHASSAGFARLQLMHARDAALSLCVYEPKGEPLEESCPVAVTFADCESIECVIAGVASGWHHCLRDGTAPGILSRPVTWQAGDTIQCQPQNETRQIVRVSQSLLVLQLTRTPARPAPTLERRTADGAVLRAVSGDKRASQQVMALAVLGALGQREAIADMARFALARENDPEARWEAVRQVAALDTAAALQLTGRIDQDDPLAIAASDLSVRIAALLAEHAREEA
ncbi:hypothetical protein [Qipengyuania nanhaisediminis]|uniref:hypothetical protein n=1 Tax=Qipengyuania nanhaisediminis TaxID=604088 RepID=UPI0038B3194D